MKNNKKGSALLCILITMSIVVPALSLLIVTSGFVAQQYACSVQYAHKKNMSQSLLHYGISICCSNFDFFCNELQTNDVVKEEGLQFTVASWPAGEDTQSNGTIIITGQNDSLLIKSQLYQNDQSAMFAASCVLHKNKQQQFVIRNWQSSIKK